MSFNVIYHPKVREDIKLLDKKQREIVSNAIEIRLRNEPEKYGKPLRGNLKGYWKLHVGDIKVIFKIVGKELQILGIIHRKMVYESITKRI